MKICPIFLYREVQYCDKTEMFAKSVVFEIGIYSFGSQYKHMYVTFIFKQKNIDQLGEKLNSTKITICIYISYVFVSVYTYICVYKYMRT